MMTVGEVRQRIGDIPFMTTSQAERITNLIRQHELRSVLELGFYHGVSTCYLANAVATLEGGSITCIDKERAKTLEPNVEVLLERIGQRENVKVYYEPTSYLWRLMKFLEEDPLPQFDFCYLDGAHNWFVDGFAFLLVDKLLRPGGWIVLDDLNWRYEDSPSFRGSESLASMPKEERETYQLRKVYELLIKRHPDYGNFRDEDNWGYAQKLSSSSAGAREITSEVIVNEKHVGLGAALIKLGRRLGLA